MQFVVVTWFFIIFLPIQMEVALLLTPVFFVSYSMGAKSQNVLDVFVYACERVGDLFPNQSLFLSSLIECSTSWWQNNTHLYLPLLVLPHSVVIYSECNISYARASIYNCEPIPDMVIDVTFKTFYLILLLLDEFE